MFALTVADHGKVERALAGDGTVSLFAVVHATRYTSFRNDPENGPVWAASSPEIKFEFWDDAAFKGDITTGNFTGQAGTKKADHCE